jgi:hypothetical protein
MDQRLPSVLRLIHLGREAVVLRSHTIDLQMVLVCIQAGRQVADDAAWMALAKWGLSSI